MKKINIITDNNIPIQRQFKEVGKYVWGDYEFVFNSEKDYDYLVILDCLNTQVKTKCPKKNRFIFLGEPPYVKLYPMDYLNQFGNIYSVQYNLYKKGIANKLMPALPWMTGCSFKNNSHECISHDCYTYNDFLTYNPVGERLDKAILLTSNKTFTIGHKQRVKFANQVIDEKIEYIDIFGNGYKHVDDKLQEMSKYKYAIVIENGKYPDYWTEKLADCMLAGCYPIYFGAPNISNYFKNGGITEIDIRNFDESINIIKECISSNQYEKSYQQMLNNRKLVLDEYNLFNIISKTINNHSSLSECLDSPETIYPIKFRFLDKVRNYISRETGIIIP